MSKNAKVVQVNNEPHAAVVMSREHLQVSFAALTEYLDELQHDALAAMGDDHTVNELHHQIDMVEDVLDNVTYALRMVNTPVVKRD